MPRMPGTAGTLAAFPLHWLASFFAIEIQWLLFAVLFAAGVWLCDRACRALKKHDDGGIVLDEIAAFYGVLLCAPDDILWQAAAFILFRLLDGLKPPPLNWLDENVGGGIGVMLDDFAAACITVAIIFAAQHWIASA